MADAGPKEIDNQDSTKEQSAGSSLTLKAAYKKNDDGKEFSLALKHEAPAGQNCAEQEGCGYDNRPSTSIEGDAERELSVHALTHQKQEQDNSARPEGNDFDHQRNTNSVSGEQTSNHNSISRMTLDIRTTNFVNRSKKVDINMRTEEEDDEMSYEQSDTEEDDEKKLSRKSEISDKYRRGDQGDSSGCDRAHVKVKSENTIMEADDVKIDMRKKKKKKKKEEKWKNPTQSAMHNLEEQSQAEDTARPWRRNYENGGGERIPPARTEVRGETRIANAPGLDYLHLFLFAVIAVLIGVIIGKYIL